jgi:choline dehydrogenase-like flavoprotein
MPYDFDVIVIGSGAGGGSFAYACAQSGKRVLLVEKGQRYSLNGQLPSEQEMLIEKRPYDDQLVRLNETPRRLYAGGVLGGGTALYGAALMRPSAEDFRPGRYYGRRLPHALWDWPISYEALEPYYTEAEKLYGVAGAPEDDFGPLRKPSGGYPRRPAAVKPINRLIVSANQKRGLKPFRLPLGIDFRSCLECSACPGHICPNGSRSSSAHLLDRAINDGLPLHVMTGVQAEQFHTGANGNIDGVCLLDRSTRQQFVYRAQRYALAGGAIGSAALLLRSGMAGRWIGRNYMTHFCPIAFGFFPRQTGAHDSFVKQLGFADYYFGAPGYPHKLGLIQSLPVPGPAMIAKATSRHLPRSFVQYMRAHMLPLAGIVEDLPNPDNRLSVDREGQPILRQRFSDYDRDRGRMLGRLMTRILRNAGARFCVVKAMPSEEHVAHQCGTLRFGNSATHAVADENCRMFGQPNLFVVDGSVFPTSLGVGPALTIIANALRVARIAVREM